MIRSMSTAVTGLRGHQQKLDVVGNNIANVNTVAFKKSQARFEDLLSQTIQGATAPLTRGGINPSQVGMGMRVSSIVDIHFQGSIMNTDRETDLAIEGEGFFIVSDGVREYYTRDGSFGRDANGEVVNVNGLKLMGWRGGGGELEAMHVPLGERMVARPSQYLSFAGNMDARSFSPPVSAEYSLDFSEVAAGTFTVSFDVGGATHTSGPIVFSTNPAVLATDIQNAISTGTSYLGGVDVIADGSGGLGDITLNFAGALADMNVPGLQVLSDTGDPLVDSGANQSWELDLDGATADDFALTFVVGGTSYITAGIAFDAVAGDIETALADTDPLWDAADFNVSGAAGVFTIEFTGNLELQQVVMTADFSNLTTPGTADLSEGTRGEAVEAADVAVLQEEAGAALIANDIFYEYYVYDSLGRRYTVDFEFAPTDRNTWDYTVSITDSENLNMPLSEGGAGQLVFDNRGNISIDSNTPNIVFEPEGAETVDFAVDFSNATQLAGTNSLLVREQDGYAAGELVAFYISRGGEIVGTYTNGMVEELGQIAMAFFSNPEGLIKEGGNLYMETANSGEVRVGLPGSEGRGLIQSSSLEMSNTDLAYEFTELITTSRAFQANTRVVTTSDEVLMEVINMKR